VIVDHVRGISLGSTPRGPEDVLEEARTSLRLGHALRQSDVGGPVLRVLGPDCLEAVHLLVMLVLVELIKESQLVHLFVIIVGKGLIQRQQ